MRIPYVFAFVAASGLAQNAAPPAFEVASVKTVQNYEPASSRMGIETPGDRFIARNLTLRMIAAWAYRIQRPQIAGPEWIDSARYEITAKASRPAGEDEMRAMLQTLLAERFKLVSHRETRQMQVMAITVPKEGHKMTPSTHEGPSQPVKDAARGTIIQGATLSELMENLSRDIGMPVLDMTGLTGRFDFALNIEKYVASMRSRMLSSRNPPSEAEARLALMQEVLAGDLGLRVDSRKAPVEIFVIYRAEQKPVEN